MITRLQVQIFPPPNFFLIFDPKTPVQTFHPPNFFYFWSKPSSRLFFFVYIFYLNNLKTADIQFINSIAGDPNKVQLEKYSGDQNISLVVKQELLEVILIFKFISSNFNFFYLSYMSIKFHHQILPSRLGRQAILYLQTISSLTWIGLQGKEDMAN